MINNTDRPLINQNITADTLNDSVRQAIGYTIADEARRLGSENGEAVFRSGKASPTFAFYFMDELSSGRRFDEEFVYAAYEFSQIADLRKQKAPVANIERILTVKNASGYSGATLQSIRRGLRTMFLHLWSKNVLLLPLTFAYDSSITENAMNDLLTEVAAFYWNFKEGKAHNASLAKSKPWLESELKHRGTKLIWTTDWHSFEKMDIYELSVRYAELLQSKDARERKAGMAIRNMLEAAYSENASRLAFNSEHLKMFSVWTHSRNYQGFSFQYYCENLAEIELQRKLQYSSKNSQRSRQKYLEDRMGASAADFDPRIPVVYSKLRKIAQTGNHDAAVDYFVKAQALNRGYASTEPYPYRKHIDVEKLSAVWQSTFKGWMEFRTAQGYESIEALRASLAILCDYLFCYLPWWQELYPEAEFDFPMTPPDFTRENFIIQIDQDTVKKPLSFFNMLKKRRLTSNSQGQAITMFSSFFEYLKGYKALYPELKDRIIENPIITTLDYPGGRKRNSKTTKVPFPKNVVPYLLRYFYAVEEFGIHLQKLSKDDEKSLSPKRRAEILNTADYGYSLKFEYGGREFRISEVPDVFSVAKRNVKKEDGTLLRCDLPALSALRMLITALETGLRLQSIQWLDLRTWDSLNAGAGSDEFAYRLLVNTDKTKTSEWQTLIVKRARDLLLREQEFQLSFAEQNTSIIPYENRPHSRFGNILPLFRSNRRESRPVNESSYHAVWLSMLFGFQKFFNKQVSPGSFTPFIKIGPRYAEGIAEKGYEVIINDLNGESYCPLRYSPIHTPHAARASFISNRASILDTEEIMNLVGHNDKVVTLYYTVEDYDQLEAKLRAVEEQIWNFDPNDPVHIRADRENSALRQSFSANRKETQERFGFVSLSLINEGEQNLEDGIELLQTTPMSRIVFRETHICPVGESCPKDIQDVIFEPRRCGICPLAVKTVDHLPAITAKMRQLLEQVKNSTVLLKKRTEQNEPQATLDEINERRKLDCLEFVGWHQSTQVLSELLQKIESQEDQNQIIYQVERPEAVKRHLKMVAKKTEQAEFILHRILDAGQYPNMETPELRAKANTLRQRLLANVNRVEEALSRIDEGNEIEAFLSSAKAVMKSYGLNSREIIERGLLGNNFGSKDMEQNSLLSLPGKSAAVPKGLS